MVTAPSFSTLVARDESLRGVALIFTVVGLAGAAVLYTVVALMSVTDVVVKIVFLPPLLLISGLVLGLFAQRAVRTLRSRLAALRRLADRGVVLEAPLKTEDWKTDSDGDRFWTATYEYTYLGRTSTLTRSISVSGTKARLPDSLHVLVDPEHLSHTYVLASVASGSARIVGWLNTASSWLMYLWLAAWAYLFFGGMRDQSGLGAIVMAGMMVGVPLAFIVLWIAMKLVSRA